MPEHFLETTPPDWTKPEMKQLWNLFVQAYEFLDDARTISKEAGIVAGTFPLKSTMRTTWFELINTLSKQGLLKRTVEIAAKDPLASSYRDRFEEMLTEEPELPLTESAKPQDWWKGIDQRNERVAQKLYYERLMAKRSRLFSIDLAQQINEKARSIAKLTLHFSNQRAYGTGFLIQPDLILTNQHNVEHPEAGVVNSIDVEFDYVENFQGEKLVRSGDVSSIVKQEQNDWAVFTLNQPVDRPLLTLGTHFSISLGDHLVIIQHPLGATKQFAIEPMAIQFIDDEQSRIQYIADTQKGSSGSPVFNMNMEVVALHHAEVEAAVKVDNQELVIWRNQGIHVKRLIQDLEAHNIPFQSA